MEEYISLKPTRYLNNNVYFKIEVDRLIELPCKFENKLSLTYGFKDELIFDGEYFRIFFNNMRYEHKFGLSLKEFIKLNKTIKEFNENFLRYFEE